MWERACPRLARRGAGRDAVVFGGGEQCPCRLEWIGSTGTRGSNRGQARSYRLTTLQGEAWPWRPARVAASVGVSAPRRQTDLPLPTLALFAPWREPASGGLTAVRGQARSYSGGGARGYNRSSLESRDAPMEDVAALSWRQRLGQWVESRGVQNAIIAVIVFNAITLGLETSESVMAAWGPTLIALEQIILAIFVVEIGLKLVAFDWRFFRSAWNVFDFAIVGISLIPASGPFAILRALRILRVLRLIAKVPRLRKLIESLLRALPSIGWVVFLLLMVFYIFAVMGTQLFGEDFPRFFGTLGDSFYTLFQVMTLESWAMSVARPVSELYPFAWVYFTAFILITSLTVLNLFIGIIVTTMQESVHADDVQQRADIEAKAHAERQEMLRLVQKVHERLDVLEQRDR